ncbi:MAG: hypothetical protein EA369_03835 [Bradymonadales bacterium]|nr:MAG: hypothetical protein EA369_03835 [Bradymonadales bacterium]
MDFKDRIESLFDTEGTDKSEPSTAEADSKAQSLDSDTQPEHPSPDERRSFSRAGLRKNEISLRFSHDAQFAKHYIENISLGGLFVKTDEKRRVGELIGIHFSVPNPANGESFDFQLKARVCRVAPNGLGVEFVNLTQDIRSRLESFVRSALPSGVAVQAKTKQASIDRLEEIRLLKWEQAQSRRERFQKFGALVALLVLNLFLGVQYVSKEIQEGKRAQIQQEYEVAGQRFRPQEVRSISQTTDQYIELTLESGESIYFSPTPANMRQLPRNFQQSIEVMRSLPKPKARRTSRNNPDRRIEIR